MTFKDKKCVCRDCGKSFTFNTQTQKQFAEKGFKPPTRCEECHTKRNSRRRYNRSGVCKVHIAPCSACGNDAELPFKPTTDKPVYCAECFKSRQEAEYEQSSRKFVLRKPRKPLHDDLPANKTAFAELELDQRLQRAISNAGYSTPTPVQAATIPICLKGRDIIGIAQTGTGKTAAFVLPILQHLLDNPVKKPCTRAIVLTPTRELAEQINNSFKELGKYTGIKSATVYGGVGMNSQEKALRYGADVIVACPGRLLDHIDRGNTDFSNVTKLVLDEADRMLDMGFLPPIKRILSHLPTERHSMLFSATSAPELTQFTKNTLRDPQRVDVDICTPPTTIVHALYPCPQHLKTSLVLNLLDKADVNSVLIFTRTKHRANRVAQQLKNAGYATAALHADKTQNQRQRAMDNFRSGRCQILVATDIAARGLDIATVSHVINYDIPATADTYIHRIGRTGRMEREGDAMTLVTPLDAAIVFEIEKTLGTRIECRKLEDFDYNVPQPPREEARRDEKEYYKQKSLKTGNDKPRSTTKAKAQKSRSYFGIKRAARVGY